MNMQNRFPWGTVLFAFVLTVAVTIGAACGRGQTFFQKGDHVVIIGNGLADRMQHHGWLETYLQAELPGLELVIRNQGFTGTASTIAHAAKVS